MTGRVALWIVLASCKTPSPSAPPPPPSPPPPADAPTTFAQPPPGAPPSSTPTGLPTTGPECRTGCPTTAPMYPTEQCRDGIHTGGRGPCVRFASGCNWSRLACPAATPRVTCKPTDCDLPIPSRWRCPDGTSIGSFTCVATEQNTCGATYRPCPPYRPPAPPPSTTPPPPRRRCHPLPSDRVLATWPIGEMCSPGGGPDPGTVIHIKDLPDGTHILEANGNCVRVRYRRCYTKCLPPEARIATPAGEVSIRDLHVGAAIWTLDSNGQRIATSVERFGSVDVAGEHHVAHVTLADGRTLIVSPEHPAIGPGVVQDLRVGDRYDGSLVVSLELVRYRGARTYDVLPSGPTGVYWANGVPLRSTLR